MLRRSFLSSALAAAAGPLLLAVKAGKPKKAKAEKRGKHGDELGEVDYKSFYSDCEVDIDDKTFVQCYFKNCSFKGTARFAVGCVFDGSDQFYVRKSMAHCSRFDESVSPLEPFFLTDGAAPKESFIMLGYDSSSAPQTSYRS